MANATTHLHFTANDATEYQAMKDKLQPNGVINNNEIPQGWTLDWDDTNLKLEVRSQNYERTDWT